MSRKFLLHKGGILLLGLFLVSNIVTFVSCAGCPYSFSGASVPSHLKSIAVPFADDRSGSGEPKLREDFTQQLTQKFIDDNNLRIAERVNADAVLECTIVSVSDAPAVVTAGEQVSTLRVSITVRVIYRDMVEKKVIFDKQFSNYGDYSSTGGIDQRNGGITAALNKLTDDILLETVSGW